MKRYQEEKERYARQKELDIENKRIENKKMLLEEGERQKEYKMQLMINNIDEERKDYEKQLKKYKQEEENLALEDKRKHNNRITNKDILVNQIKSNKVNNKEK